MGVIENGGSDNLDESTLDGLKGTDESNNGLFLIDDRNVHKIVSDISKNVQLLIEHTSKIDKCSDIYSNLENDLFNYMMHFLKNSKDKGFMMSYFKKENEDYEMKTIKVESKVSKNLSIFLPIVAEHIRQILNGKDISSDESKVLIKQYFIKFIRVLFTFGDKLDFNLLDGLLDLDSKELVNISRNFIETANILEKNENFINEDITDMGDDIYFTKNSYSSILYRTCLRKSFEQYFKSTEYKKNKKSKDEGLESIDFNDKISKLLEKNIENEIKIIFNKFYDIFTVLLNSNDSNTIEGLKILGEGLKKMFYYIDIFKTEGIAFNNFNFGYGNSNDYIILFSKLVGGSIEGNKELFCNLIISTEDFIDKYSSEGVSTKTEDKKYDLDKKINIPGSEIDYGDWIKLTNHESHQYFLNNVLVTDETTGFISVNQKSLRFNNGLYNGFSELYKLDNDDIINDQVKYIKNKLNGGITLKDFIDDDVNNFQFLYNYWRYTLCERVTGKKKIDFYKKVIIKNNGFTNGLRNYLESENLIDVNDFDNKYLGTVTNTSGYSIGKYVDGFFASMSRGSIDLSKYKVGPYIISKLQDMYCPGEETNLEEVTEYLNIAMDTCIDILQGKTLLVSEEKNNYYKVLKKYGYLPDDLSKLNKLQKSNLVKLLMGLKTIYSKSKTLGEMHNKSKADYRAVYDLLKGFLGNDFNDGYYHPDLQSGIGPEKQYGRAFIKLIEKYNGDYYKIGDLVRLRITADSIDGIRENILNLIKLSKQDNIIESIKFDDFVGDIFSISKKESGYRDFKIDFKLTNGNTVELQLHFKKVLSAKNMGINIDDDVRKKLISESAVLNKDELDILIRHYYNTFNQYIPLNIMKSLGDINGYYEKELLNNPLIDNDSNVNISCDQIYDLRRSYTPINKKKVIDDIPRKLERIERVFFDNAWKDVTLEYINNDLNLNVLPANNGKNKKK